MSRLEASHREPEMPRAMRRVLTIAYDFPPRRTSGVYRITGLLRHLSRFGWSPTVLTVSGADEELEDSTLLRNLDSSIRIEHATDLKVSGWEKKAEVAIHAAGGLKSDHRERRQPIWDRWIRGAGQLVRSTFYFPDDTVGWIPLALSRAIELQMQHRFDLVYTTSPPRSAPVVGLMLKRLLGIPWVAEFRDPWYPPIRPWRRAFERAHLRRMLDAADAVITTSKGLATEFEQSFSLTSQKISAINNGFNEDDFLAGASVEDKLMTPGYFNFSHFGTVYPGLSGRFFDALRELLRESPDLKTRVRVNIIGFPDETIRREAASDDLGEVIRLHGFVDHRSAIAAMKASDCLLIFLGHREMARLAVAGKTYEYLRTGRPILAVTYTGDTATLIGEGKAGWVLSPDDTPGMKAALAKLFNWNASERSMQGARFEYAAQFRYTCLAEKLAGAFNSVIRHDT